MVTDQVYGRRKVSSLTSVRSGGSHRVDGELMAVPNCSEGRDPDRIARLVDATRMTGVRVLDVHSDADHHRTVITLAGSAGGAPMSPSIARKVLGLMRGQEAAAKPAGGGELAILTERELELLEHVAAGAGDKEIAEALGLSRSTVKNALLVIYQKWRVRSRTEAAVKFTRLQDGRP